MIPTYHSDTMFRASTYNYFYDIYDDLFKDSFDLMKTYMKISKDK